MYVSTDDIMSINGIEYEITGISDDYHVFIQDHNKMQQILPVQAFMQMLKSNDFKYIRNLHDENLKKNRLHAC